MKDRWKIFWISVFMGLILAALFLFMGFSLRKVDLGNYGVLRYDYYDTVDPVQAPRTNGNYLVGLDHSFIQFSRGYLVHQFTFTTLTKDKSMIQISGMYMGKLIYSELVSLYFNYGRKYADFLFSSVEQLFHEAIEQFSLNQIISDRISVDSYVKNYVKSNIAAQYQWVSTKYVNLGGIKTDLLISSLLPDTQIQSVYLAAVNRGIQNQRKYNIYESGGFQMLKNVQSQQSELFFNISKKIKAIADNLQAKAKPNQILPAIEYIINSQSLPLLDNQIQMQISR